MPIVVVVVGLCLRVTEPVSFFPVLVCRVLLKLETSPSPLDNLQSKQSGAQAQTSKTQYFVPFVPFEGSRLQLLASSLPPSTPVCNTSSVMSFSFIAHLFEIIVKFSLSSGAEFDSSWVIKTSSRSQRSPPLKQFRPGRHSATQDDDG